MTALRAGNPKCVNAGLALIVVLGITLLDLAGAQGMEARHSPGNGRSYHDRTGFPQRIEKARGVAKGFKSPTRRAASVRLL